MARTRSQNTRTSASNANVSAQPSRSTGILRNSTSTANANSATAVAVNQTQAAGASNNNSNVSVPSPMRDVFELLGASRSCAECIVEVHGIESVDELANYLDEDLSKLFDSLRRPGGNSQGFQVGMGFLKRLKNCAMFCRVAMIAQRQIEPAAITLEAIASYDIHREKIVNHKEPEEKPKPSDKASMVKTLEEVEDYIDGHINPKGVPLSYVIRENVAPTVKERDEFPNIFEEMKERAPLAGPSYDADKQRVYTMLMLIFRGHHAEVYVTKHAKERDGRAAWKSLRLKYYGSNFMITESARLEARLSTISWERDRKGWNLDQCLDEIVELHSAMKRLVPLGYAMRDKASQVRDLVNAIKSSPEMSAVVALIRANPALISNLDRSMDLVINTYRADIKDRSYSKKIGVESVESIHPSGFDPDDPAKIVPASIYNRFTPEEKRLVYEARKAERKSESSDESSESDSEVTLTAMIALMKVQ